MTRSTLRFVCVALVLFGPEYVSAQRVSEERRAWADTIPVDTLLAWHVERLSAPEPNAWSPYLLLLWDYVEDPQSARGDTVFDAMLEIAETSDGRPLMTPAVHLLIKGEAARPGERTAVLVDLFERLVDERSRLRVSFLSDAQHASPQFRTVVASWITDKLERGDVDEYMTEVLVGRLGSLGEPGITRLRRLIEEERLPPMFGGLSRAREMLERAIARQGGGGGGGP